MRACAGVVAVAAGWVDMDRAHAKGVCVSTIRLSSVGGLFGFFFVPIFVIFVTVGVGAVDGDVLSALGF